MGIPLEKYEISEPTSNQPYQFKKYVINAGEYFTGEFDYLIVFVDNDAKPFNGSNSIFKNVKLK